MIFLNCELYPGMDGYLPFSFLRRKELSKYMEDADPLTVLCPTLIAWEILHKNLHVRMCVHVQKRGETLKFIRQKQCAEWKHSDDRLQPDCDFRNMEVDKHHKLSPLNVIQQYQL